MWHPYMKAERWGWLFTKLVTHLTQDERTQLYKGLRRERTHYFFMGVLVGVIIEITVMRIFK